MVFSIFPIAPSARDNNIGTDLVVFDEIRAIERAIIVAIQAGQLETSIDGTTMTTIGDAVSEDYWKVWDGTLTDRLKQLQMNNVETYFKERKYSIARQANNRYTLTGVTLANSGTGYIPSEVLTVDVGSGVSNIDATITVNTTQVHTYNIVNGGSGYQEGNIVRITSGVFVEPAEFEVVTATGGVVSALALINSGSYTTNPSVFSVLGSPTSAFSGIGSGLTLNLGMGIRAATLTNGGAYGKLPTSPVSVDGTGVDATFLIDSGSMAGTTFKWGMKW